MLRLLFGGIFIFMTCISRCRAAEPTFVISFSTQAPPSGQQFQSMLDFKQRVEAESHGQCARTSTIPANVSMTITLLRR
jgi:TRAP-type C4-dicarboxylate transport system substrate-binding protein